MATKLCFGRSKSYENYRKHNWEIEADGKKTWQDGLLPEEWQRLRQEVRQAISRGSDSEMKTACQKLIDSPAGELLAFFSQKNATSRFFGFHRRLLSAGPAGGGGPAAQRLPAAALLVCGVHGAR